MAAWNAIKSSGQGARTPLHLAAANGDILIIEELLKNGASVYAKDDDGNTPMHLAAMEGNIECCKKLLDAPEESSKLVKNNKGKTPSDMSNSSYIKELINNHQDLPYPKYCFG